jgi:CBS domain-containing protein
MNTSRVVPDAGASPPHGEADALANVGDVMSGEVVVIDADATLGQALERLTASRLRHLVVVVPGGNGRRCVGVLADRHLAAFWPFDPSVLERRKVRSVLPPPQPFVRAHEGLDHVASLMLFHDRDAVPVLDDDDELVGIVTVTDILSAVATRPERRT